MLEIRVCGGRISNDNGYWYTIQTNDLNNWQKHFFGTNASTVSLLGPRTVFFSKQCTLEYTYLGHLQYSY